MPATNCCPVTPAASCAAGIAAQAAPQPASAAPHRPSHASTVQAAPRRDCAAKAPARRQNGPQAWLMNASTASYTEEDVKHCGSVAVGETPADAWQQAAHHTLAYMLASKFVNTKCPFAWSRITEARIGSTGGARMCWGGGFIKH